MTTFIDLPGGGSTLRGKTAYQATLQAEGQQSGTCISTQPKSRRGRRSVFDPQKTWSILLPLIASGQSLTGALQRLRPAPSYWWAKEALRRDPELRARYQEAVEDRADRLAEELLELADREIPQDLDGSARSAFVQQLRLRVDARKWVAAKLRPRTYGDRLDVSVQETRISISAALALAEARVVRGVAETAQVGLAPLPTARLE